MSTVTVPSLSGRYRKLPSLTWDRGRTADLSQAGKEGRCSRLTGHVLVVKGDRIECQSCGATWRDERF